MERLNNLDQVRLPMDALFVQCQNQQTEEPTLVRPLCHLIRHACVLPVIKKGVCMYVIAELEKGIGRGHWYLVVVLAACQVYNIQLLAMGYVRLSAKDRAGFAVDVLKCLPRKSSAQQAR